MSTPLPKLGSCVWRRTREAHSPEVCVRRSISPGDRRWQCELVSSLLGGYQHGTPRRLPSCCALSPSCGCSQKRSAKCASLSSPSALRAAAPPRPLFRCPRCRVLRRLTEFREFSRLFLSLLSRCLLLSSLAFEPLSTLIGGRAAVERPWRETGLR